MSCRPARYDAPGRVSKAPTTKVVLAVPLLSVCCHFGGPLLRERSARRAVTFACLSVAITKASARARVPSTMSAAGLRVFCVVLTAPESSSENTMISPSVMLVIIAPPPEPVAEHQPRRTRDQQHHRGCRDQRRVQRRGERECVNLAHCDLAR